MTDDPAEMAPTGAAPRFAAVIFDMDGVVTDTAGLHAAAWKQIFDDFLASHLELGGGRGGDPFDAEVDYRNFVDGRSREDGVAAFLASRGVALATGGPGDPPTASTVWALADAKNRLFVTLAARDGVRAFPSTVELLGRLRALGVRTGLVSASRNAAEILTAADVAGLFDVRVDGADAAALGLAGKPDPAMFVEAARRLGVDPAAAVVVEDATAGVAAAHVGGFGLVVGVDRGARRDELVAAGADIVVDDLAELDLGAIRTDPWVVVYEGFDPAHETHREALCTLGNGYVATRGASPEAADDGIHYPGTYLAGVYNRLTTLIGGRPVEDEHLVNAPNWLPLDLRVAGGPWWSAGGLRTLAERSELDLRRGVLTRRATLADPDGRRLRIVQRRLVSMARPHLGALETIIVAENWTGTVEVRSGIDGRVVNNNVAEFRGLANRHLVVLAAEHVEPDTALLEAQTSHSAVRIAVAARTRVAGKVLARRSVIEGDRVAELIGVAVTDGEAVVADKVAAIVTSRDLAIASPRLAALTEVSRAPGFASLLTGHEQAWGRLWERFAVEVDADSETALTLNLHVFHLLQALSPHTAALDAGVGARGLHGEGYRGHVFWDELFVFPLLTMRLPALTRALLGYRWRRLDEARAAARQAGLAGALFPWQSGSDGREETPTALFNARSGRWMADNSHLQRHVGLAVAYNAWQYYQATADIDFLVGQGAELIIEVARLVASLASHDPAADRYDIVGVMGPDEYHDAYPDAPEPGLRNNAYTNVTAAWVCWRAVEVVGLLAGYHCGELWERLGLGAAELEHWERLSRRLRVGFHADGVISQFDGYENLAELDWHRYRAVYGNIGRLDLILNAEGDSTNRYQLAKQADVLMLVYLFGPAELEGLFERLGYPLGADTLARTVDYYLARTAHGSTLSRVVHASVLASLDPARSWSTFREALRADLDDTQGGTTGEGVHLGAMAGTVDVVLRAYAGVATRDDTLWFEPRLPDGLPAASFTLFYRSQQIGVSLTTGRLRVTLAPCAAGPVRIGVGGMVHTVGAGDTHEFPVPRPTPAGADDPPRRAG